MKKNSIKSKLLLLLFLSVGCSFIILGFYNSSNAYKAEYNLVKEREIGLSTDISKYLDSYFESKITILNAIAASIKDYDLNISNQDIVRNLYLGKESGSFALLFLGFENNGHEIKSDGKFLTKERNNFDARIRPWYKLAIKLGHAGITKPYIAKSSGKLVVSLFTLIKKNGKVIGVLGSDIYMDTVLKTLSSAKMKGLDYTYLLNKQGHILVHKNKKMINTEDKNFKDVVIEQKENFSQIDQDGTSKLVTYSLIPGIQWYVGIMVDKESIFKDIKENIINEILLYIILLILILTTLFYFLNKILSPLGKFETGLYSFFSYLKGNSESVKKLNIHTKDEFGSMAKVIDDEIEEVTNNMEMDKKLINEVTAVVSEIKIGKINKLIETSTENKSLNELKNILNDMIDVIRNNINHDTNVIIDSLDAYSKFNFLNKIEAPSGKVAIGLNTLSTIITEMLQENKSNGEALNSTSDLLLKNVKILNQTTSNTAVSLEETASSIEEITSTVNTNTQKINLVKSHSDELIDSINHGQTLANQTASAMDEINQQSKAIQESINVIDQIAFQTNILSLNAAVEAATAGEAGKGFAVVAQEVRNLASRSAEAAKEIKGLVEAGTEKTNLGKQIADNMIQDYKNLNINIAKTTDLIDDITISFHEQKTSIEQINDVVNKLDSQTQSNASIASETNDIAFETSNIAHKILENVNNKQFIDKS